MPRGVRLAALLSLALEPGIDPIGTCCELGVKTEPFPPGVGAAGGEAEDGAQEGSD